MNFGICVLHRSLGNQILLKKQNNQVENFKTKHNTPLKCEESNQIIFSPLQVHIAELILSLSPYEMSCFLVTTPCLWDLIGESVFDTPLKLFPEI